MQAVVGHLHHKREALPVGLFHQDVGLRQKVAVAPLVGKEVVAFLVEDVSGDEPVADFFIQGGDVAEEA